MSAFIGVSTSLYISYCFRDTGHSFRPRAMKSCMKIGNLCQVRQPAIPFENFLIKWLKCHQDFIPPAFRQPPAPDVRNFQDLGILFLSRTVRSCTSLKSTSLVRLLPTGIIFTSISSAVFQYLFESVLFTLLNHHLKLLDLHTDSTHNICTISKNNFLRKSEITNLFCSTTSPLEHLEAGIFNSLASGGDVFCEHLRERGLIRAGFILVAMQWLPLFSCVIYGAWCWLIGDWIEEKGRNTSFVSVPF